MAQNFFIEEIDFKFKEKRDIKSWIKNVISSEKKVVGNINYIFTSDKVLIEINKKFLKHNTYTDILTFNYNQNEIINGDIYISIERVRENYKLYSESFELELFRVIIHGVLHLVGYDDVNEELKLVMREKEDFYLKLFKFEFFNH